MRFVVALILWIFVGVLVAATAVGQAPPDYSLLVGYGVACVAWIVSYWIRARSGTARRWWWLGGILEVVLVALERRLGRARARTQTPPDGVRPPNAAPDPVGGTPRP